jgi:hypothetical protein
MTDRFDLSLVLGAGVIAEIVLLTLPGFRLGRIVRLALAVAAGAVVWAAGRVALPDLAHIQVVVAASAFALAAFLLLKNEILPRVSESSLLLGTLVLWYLLVNVDAPREVFYALAAVAALPSLGTLVIALLIHDWGFRVRLACYLWFLVLSGATTVLLLGFGALSFVITDSFSPPNPLSVLAGGMGFTYLAACVFYFWTVVPFFRRGRLEQWWSDARLMASRFADYEMRIPEVVATIVVPGGLFALNSEWRVIPVTFLASAVLVLQRYGSMLFRRSEAQTQAAVPPAG